MSLGLKRKTVALEPHDDAWDASASRAIEALRGILGDLATDIQHVGSTSIRSIWAKPIVDIAVCARDPSAVRRKDGALAAAGIIFRKEEYGGQLLYVMGEGDIRTHHIHVVKAGEAAWGNYILFRDYLNAHEDAARRYCERKLALAAAHADDREAYTLGKGPLIERLLNEARRWDRDGRE